MDIDQTRKHKMRNLPSYASPTGGLRVNIVIFLLFLHCPLTWSGYPALIIIDVQNCFTYNGTLAVSDGNEVIPVINEIRFQFGTQFSLVVFTQDWHCFNHVSFASQHYGFALYDTINLTYLNTGELCESNSTHADYTVDCANRTEQTLVVQQFLWPDHCVQNTTDAAIHQNLYRTSTDILVQKGYHCQIDSYSAFFDNGGIAKTDLDEILTKHSITAVFLTGLATDYCVYHTAKDAKNLGYETYVLLDATRGVAPVTTEEAVKDMIDLGIKVVNTSDLSWILSSASGSEIHLQLVVLTTCLNFIKNCYLD